MEERKTVFLLTLGMVSFDFVLVNQYELCREPGQVGLIA